MTQGPAQVAALPSTFQGRCHLWEVTYTPLAGDETRQRVKRPQDHFSYRCQEPLCCLAVRICAEGPPWSHRRMYKSPPSHTDQPEPPLSLPRRTGTLQHLLRCLIWSTVTKRFTVCLALVWLLLRCPMPGPKASPAAACPAAGQSASISDFHPHPRSGATGRTGSLPWHGLV